MRYQQEKPQKHTNFNLKKSQNTIFVFDSPNFQYKFRWIDFRFDYFLNIFFVQQKQEQQK